MIRKIYICLIFVVVTTGLNLVFGADQLIFKIDLKKDIGSTT